MCFTKILPLFFTPSPAHRALSEIWTTLRWKNVPDFPLPAGKPRSHLLVQLFPPCASPPSFFQPPHFGFLSLFCCRDLRGFCWNSSLNPLLLFSFSLPATLVKSHFFPGSGGMGLPFVQGWDFSLKIQGCSFSLLWELLFDCLRSEGFGENPFGFLRRKIH